MKLKLTSWIVLFLQSINGSCISQLISKSNYACGKSNSYNSKASNFPSQFVSKVSQISVAVAFKITDMCSATYPLDFFTIAITPPGSLEKKLSRSYIALGATTDMTAAYEDSNGPVDLGSLTSLINIGVGSRFEIFITIDLATNNLQYTAMIDGFYLPQTSPAGTLDFTGWQFDSTTKFHICSGATGISTISCFVEYLSVSYGYFSSTEFQYIGGLDATLLAAYTLDQKSGTAIPDATNKLGRARFGTPIPAAPSGSSPQWLTTEAGIEFTTANDYMLIPNFDLKPSTGLVRASLGITFWIKVETINSGQIFRIVSPDLITDQKIKLELNVDQTMTAEINNAGGTIATTDMIPLSTWTQITAIYTLYDLDSSASIVVYFGETVAGRNTMISSATLGLTFLASDVFLIGGPNSFRGKMVNFRIYTPASQSLTQPTCSSAYSSCTLSFSLIDLSFKNCLNCPTGSKFYNSECLVCSAGQYSTGYQCEDFPSLSESLADTIEAAERGTQVATQVVSAIVSASSAGISASVSGKIFSNIKYLNISYSYQLGQALQTWKSNFLSLGFNSDMPERLESKIGDGTVPYVFEKYDVPASFLKNFWEPFILLITLGGVLGLVKILILSSKNKASLYSRLLLKARLYLFNFILAQIYSVCGDVALFAILEFRSLDLSENLSFLSFIASIALFVLMIFLLYYHIWFLDKYQSLKKASSSGVELEQFKENNQDLEMLYQDFKDQNIFKQSFLFLLTVRDILFSLILITLFEHPLAQCILILILSMTMLAYLFIFKPFASVWNQIQQIFFEFIIFVVSLSTLILAAMDRKDTDAETPSRQRIGRLLIVVNLIFNFAALGFMILQLTLQGIEIYKNYKSNKISPQKNTIVQGQDDSSNIQIQESQSNLQTDSLSFSQINKPNNDLLVTKPDTFDARGPFAQNKSPRKEKVFINNSTIEMNLFEASVNEEIPENMRQINYGGFVQRKFVRNPKPKSKLSSAICFPSPGEEFQS